MVETRGTEADLEKLPRSHAYFGTFFPETSPGTSAAGGGVIAVGRELVDRAARATTKVHAKGRAIIVTLHLAVNLSFTALHLDPALFMAAQTRLMNITAQHVQRTSGIKFVSGAGTSRLQARSA